MAHLHVVSVHPFRDGNGRISRIVQSLALAREGLVSPEFGSIEEYLGRHTPAYHAALMEAQGGSYQPGRDASRWINFCVRPHLDQARQRPAQIAAAGARWSFLESLVEARSWPDRFVIALEQSLIGGSDRLIAQIGLPLGASPEVAVAPVVGELVGQVPSAPMEGHRSSRRRLWRPARLRVPASSS